MIDLYPAALVILSALFYVGVTLIAEALTKPKSYNEQIEQARDEFDKRMEGIE